MNLSQLKPLDEITIELVHPETGEVLFDEDDQKVKGRKPLTVTIKSKESDESKKITRKRMAENAAKAKLNQKKNKELTVADIERLERQGIEDLAALTVDVYIKEDDKRFVELADIGRIYKTWPWVRQQVEEALNDKGKLYSK